MYMERVGLLCQIPINPQKRRKGNSCDEEHQFSFILSLLVFVVFFLFSVLSPLAQWDHISLSAYIYFEGSPCPALKRSTHEGDDALHIEFIFFLDKSFHLREQSKGVAQKRHEAKERRVRGKKPNACGGNFHSLAHVGKKKDIAHYTEILIS